MLIEATEVAVEEDEDISYVWFADAAKRYLGFYRPRESFRKPGDQVYVERDDQSRATYGGVTTVELHRDHVKVVFDADAAAKLGLTEGREITARFSLPATVLGDLRAILGRIFEGQADYRDRTAEHAGG